MCKNREPWADFVGYDLFGYEYNCKYPPNKERNGNEFGGYPTPNQQTFFYDFCILQYGVSFYYGEDNYEVEFTAKGIFLTNRTSGEIQGPFEDAVNLLETSNIKGKSLLDIIDEIENVVLH